MDQGVLHNHGRGSFFKNTKVVVGPKLRLKSILLFYKDTFSVRYKSMLTIGFLGKKFERHPQTPNKSLFKFLCQSLLSKNFTDSISGSKNFGLFR